jgi:hypothetical protein
MKNKHLLIVMISFFSTVILLIWVLGAEKFWSGVSAGFSISFLGLYLHSLSIKSITGLKAGFLRRYFAGMVLRFAILTAVFCILVFLFKINTAGIISGAGAGLMISSIVLVLRANKAGR